MNFKKHLLITIGIPAGISLILITTIFVINSDINRKVQEITTLRADLLFRLNLAESLAVLNQDSQEAQKYTTELDTVLLDRNKLIGFPRELAGIARQNKIDLNSALGQESPIDSETLRQTNFMMTGQGTFENFINFLKTLEISRYFINLSSIDLTREQSIFRIIMNGRVFSL